MKSVLLFLLVPLTLLPRSGAADLRDLCGYSDSVGEWKICIEADRLKSLPEFDPSKENPPVAIPQAIAEARRSLAHQFPQVKKWEFSEIIFGRAQFKDVGFWEYTVRLYADPGTDSVDIFEAWIAMDGKALVRELVQKKSEPSKWPERSAGPASLSGSTQPPGVAHR